MNRGFTLFEMLVSLAIFMLLTTTLLVKNSQFKGNVVIGNTAYQLALAFREAQAYGVNVRGLNQSNSYIYTIPYGIHFDSSSPSSYMLFGDTYPVMPGSPNLGDRIYTKGSGGSDTLVRSYDIPGGTSVVMFCTIRPNGSVQSNGFVLSNGSTVTQPPVCSGDPAAGGLTTLDVTFLRPQLSAVIRDSSQTQPPNLYALSALVVLKNAQGVCKGVRVSATGGVEVVDNPTTLSEYKNSIASVCP